MFISVLELILKTVNYSKTNYEVKDVYKVQ